MSAMELETDQRRLEQRQKQVKFGLTTSGYINYDAWMRRYGSRGMKTIPLPNIYEKCSKRTWDQQMREWRRELHRWDNVDVASADLCPTREHMLNRSVASDFDNGSPGYMFSPPQNNQTMTTPFQNRVPSSQPITYATPPQPNFNSPVIQPIISPPSNFSWSPSFGSPPYQNKITRLSPSNVGVVGCIPPLPVLFPSHQISGAFLPAFAMQTQMAPFQPIRNVTMISPPVMHGSSPPGPFPPQPDLIRQGNLNSTSQSGRRNWRNNSNSNFNTRQHRELNTKSDLSSERSFLLPSGRSNTAKFLLLSQQEEFARSLVYNEEATLHTEFTHHCLMNIIAVASRLQIEKNLLAQSLQQLCQDCEGVSQREPQVRRCSGDNELLRNPIRAYSPRCQLDSNFLIPDRELEGFLPPSLTTTEVPSMLTASRVFPSLSDISHSYDPVNPSPKEMGRSEELNFVGSPVGASRQHSSHGFPAPPPPTPIISPSFSAFGPSTPSPTRRNVHLPVQWSIHHTPVSCSEQTAEGNPFHQVTPSEYVKSDSFWGRSPSPDSPLTYPQDRRTSSPFFATMTPQSRIDFPGSSVRKGAQSSSSSQPFFAKSPIESSHGVCGESPFLAVTHSPTKDAFSSSTISDDVFDIGIDCDLAESLQRALSEFQANPF